MCKTPRTRSPSKPVATLRHDSRSQNLQQGSEVAARAFGDLFVGAGWFAAKLPPPANVCAQILENCGDVFVNMQRLLDPMKRPGGQGGQMREVWSGFECGEY
jgi:hypothetical protein